MKLYMFKKAVDEAIQDGDPTDVCVLTRKELFEALREDMAFGEVDEVYEIDTAKCSLYEVSLETTEKMKLIKASTRKKK